MNRSLRSEPPDICPSCGGEVPPRAVACPHCGADETTGWSEAARHDDLNLPDQDFDYEAFVEEEFGGNAVRHRHRRGGVFWFIVTLLALIAFVWLFVFGGF